MGDNGELANAVNTDLQNLVDFEGIEETVIDNISLENQGMFHDKATPKKTTNELLGQVAKNTKSYTGELTEDQQTQLKNLELETLKVDLSKLKA